MPWLSEEIPDWVDLDEDERDEIKNLVVQLGMAVCEEDDYFE